jgi:hypothetical protein
MVPEERQGKQAIFQHLFNDDKTNIHFEDQGQKQKQAAAFVPA